MLGTCTDYEFFINELKAHGEMAEQDIINFHTVFLFK